MGIGKLVASLDVIIGLLADPNWSVKVKKVKTLKEMRQILLNFCKAHGKVIRIDEDIYIYL